MRLPIFQLDAFADRLFSGNPAAVVLLDAWLDDVMLAAIAAENNLSETAFLVREGGDYRIRWFTPTLEVPLCGHATLAAAAVVMERIEPGRRQIRFHSASGPLDAMLEDELYAIDLPSRPAARIPVFDALSAALGVAAVELWANSFNYMAVLDGRDAVAALTPDLAAVAALDRPGLIATAPGAGAVDFVSRYFAPAKGIDEDPVTGGAHCTLVPYWSARLTKTGLRALQLSARGGELLCTAAGDRVRLSGRCVFYLEGELLL